MNFGSQVPELWERYVEEVDKEQEMWLNSFTVSPFRIPMPPELEYLWGKGICVVFFIWRCLLGTHFFRD